MAALEKKQKITWDEDVIAEHDKLRGTRMKIDEPDTPYARYDPADDPDVVQGATLVCGGALTLGCVASLVPGGLRGIIDEALAAYKLSLTG